MNAVTRFQIFIFEHSNLFDIFTLPFPSKRYNRIFPERMSRRYYYYYVGHTTTMTCINVSVHTHYFSTVHHSYYVQYICTKPNTCVYYFKEKKKLIMLIFHNTVINTWKRTSSSAVNIKYLYLYNKTLEPWAIVDNIMMFATQISCYITLFDFLPWFIQTKLTKLYWFHLFWLYVICLEPIKDYFFGLLCVVWQGHHRRSLSPGTSYSNSTIHIKLQILIVRSVNKET
jgi:hypothetical protein